MGKVKDDFNSAYTLFSNNCAKLKQYAALFNDKYDEYNITQIKDAAILKTLMIETLHKAVSYEKLINENKTEKIYNTLGNNVSSGDGDSQ